MTPMRPGQILVSRTGRKVAFVRTEARTEVVGESGKRLLKVPVKGGEPMLVVRNLEPYRDNAGKWWPGQELNGRYSQQDIDSGVLTPTDDMAPETVPDEEPKKRAGKSGKEAAVSETKRETVPAQPAPRGGVDVPVVTTAEPTAKVRKPRQPQAPDAIVVITTRGTQAERDEINAAADAAGENSGTWILQILLAAARSALAKPTQG